MVRVLLASSLFLLTSAVQAQQPDTLRPRSPALHSTAADSLPTRPAVLDGLAYPVRCPVARVSVIDTRLPPFTTIQPALSSAAGVQVTPYSGAPGAWSTVRIRGVANVTGNSQPLYVVDGVPAYNTEVTPEMWSASEEFVRRTFPFTFTPRTPMANPLLDLPVEDIAQVEVLKGAAATARYGMQGTNGVILISTRRGADGGTTPQPLRVRYAGWGGVQQVRQRYALLNARQYASLANEAETNAGQPAPYSAADLNNLRETDWQDRVFRVAGMQSHNLSVDGLTRHTRYYVAADYLQQAGVVRESGLSRYQLRANLDQHLTNKLSVGLRASVGQTNQYYPGTESDAGPLLQQALLASPTSPPGNAAGAPDTGISQQLDYFSRASRTRRLLAQLSATYQFSSGLSATVRASRQLALARQLAYGPDFDAQYQIRGVVENGTDSTTSRSWVLDAALHYQRTFGTSHALTAGLGYLRQRYERELSQHTYFGAGGVGVRTSFTNREASAPLHSATAWLNYTYAGRYEVQASLRSDYFAFSPDGPRSGFSWLPGGQLSWHLHKEAFLANASGLSDLTLWAGTGQTSSSFSADRTTHHDAGLRAGLLGGHLTLEVAAYQRRTRHARTLITVPALGGSGIGYLSPDVTLLNRGLELTVGSTWQLGPLAGTTQLAAAANRNQVEAVDNGPYSGGTFTFSGLEAGQPLARFLVYEQSGTYPLGSSQAGQMRFRDRNGDGRINYSDAYAMGSGLPRYTLNLYQELRFRRFQLTAQLDGLFGYQLHNPTFRTLDEPTGFYNSSVRALDYWTPAHQNTNIPSPGNSSSPYLSDQALASGNHLRLSQLTVAYEVLRQETRRVSVWVGGQNLFVTSSYRGFDPNVSSGGAAPLQAGLDASVYPVARVWQLGVRGQF